MDDLVKDFLQESTENLDRLDQEFVQLESDPGNPKLLGSIFRTIHTIKGSCGFLGFTRLEKLAHAGESLLSDLRDSAVELAPEIADSLLQMVDAIRKMLQAIQITSTDGDDDHAELIAILKSFQAPRTELPPTDTHAVSPAGSPKVSTVSVTQPPLDSSTASVSPQSDVDSSAPPRLSKKQRQELNSKKLGGVLVRKANLKPDDVLLALQMQQEGDPRRLGEILVELGLVTKQQVEEIVRDFKSEDQKDATIRVGVELLDKIINQVSELVLLRNRLLQLGAKQRDTDLKKTIQSLNQLTTDLRKQTMKVRLQPVSSLFDRFPRTIRDTAHQCGKKVRLETTGGGTELDKKLLEAIKDPLTHIVRNSVDHGIELPERRRKAGKSDEGIISLHAYHEGGKFHLRVSDDGAGIDLEAVRSAALQKKLVPPSQLTRMNDQEILGLIFLPGFSTAKQVSNLSGRGVGMDVVKTNIEGIGGKVRLESEPGKGTQIQLSIPLTLATIPALTITSASKRYAIPQAALVELVRLDGERAKKLIDHVGETSVYRLRNRTIPLVFLNRELSCHPSAEDEQGANMIVLRAESSVFGLVVDDVNDTEEIVVKPLGEQLKDISVFSGATVLGNGKVALILDVAGLARRSRAMSADNGTKAATADASGQKTGKRIQLLLLSGPKGERIAVPLSLVKRLEMFPRSSIERIGSSEVAQYRNDLIPIISLSHLIRSEDIQLAEPSAPASQGPEERIPVVVYTGHDLTVGVRADRILDIVYAFEDTMRPLKRRGFLGSMVINNKVTEVLDLEHALSGIKLEELDHQEELVEMET